ncbi:hypothetical protein J7K18_04705 [bacterium]|nr:hypothetical protein [bacterium]
MAEFRFRLLTPEGEVFSEDIEYLSCFTPEGSLGILAGHYPLVAKLVPGETLYVRGSNDEHWFVLSGGFLNVRRDETVVVSDVALESTREKVKELASKLGSVRNRLEIGEKPSAEREEFELKRRIKEALSSMRTGK